MARRENVAESLSGMVLPDAISGGQVDLGELTGVQVITAIRHRF